MGKKERRKHRRLQEIGGNANGAGFLASAAGGSQHVSDEPSMATSSVRRYATLCTEAYAAIHNALLLMPEALVDLVAQYCENCQSPLPHQFAAASGVLSLSWF